MPSDIGIPLREILNHPGFSNVKLVAGAGGLDRLVKFVNVMEVPDILDWVKEGELLLTTVYAIRDDAGAQSRLISQLATKNLAGLAIKPGRYIEKIPDIMVTQAEENNLPLLELPPEASFTDIINPIISEISNKQAIVLKRADEVHARLSQVVLAGGDLQEIANTLSDLLNHNLVLIQTTIRSTVVAPIDMSDLVATLQTVAEEMENFAAMSTNRGIASVSGKEVSYVRRPIHAGNNVYGFITVFEVNGPISGRDELTVERAATIAALAMVHHLAVTEVERRYYSEFFNEMLVAGADEESKIRQRAKRLGINLASSHVAAVVHLDKKHISEARGNSSEAAEWEESMQQLLRQGMQSLRVRYPEIAVGHKFDCLVMLIPKPSASAAKVKHMYKESIYKIASYIKETIRLIDSQVRVLIGVGRYASGLGGLQTSYRQAVQAFQIGQNVWTDADIYYFDELGIWRLLGGINDKAELKNFVKETVGPIIAYDEERGTDLLTTLEVYFECRGNLKQVAETMFIHYNTVLYRLERIVQITGVDLDDAADSLNFQIGLKILKILEI